MKRYALAAIVMILVCATISCQDEEKPIPPPPDLTESALRFVDSMVTGDFEAAAVDFNDVMRSHMPASKLKADWATIISRNGALCQLGGVRSAKVSSFICLYVNCEFTRRELDVKLVYDKADRIAGLWFVDPHPRLDYKPVAQTAVRLKQQQDVETEEAKGAVHLANTFVELLSRGEFEAAAKHFDDTMAEKVSPEMLGGIWASLVEENGAFRKVKGSWAERSKDTDIVFVPVEFERYVVDLKVVVNRDRKVSGFWIVGSTPADSKALDLGQRFVKHLIAGEYTDAQNMFGEGMKKAMTAQALQETWETILLKYGPVKRQTRSIAMHDKGVEIVFVTCEFDNVELDVKVVFDPNRMVSGLWFEPKAEYASPEYADEASFTEGDVVVGRGAKWELPGTLTMPLGEGPFPVVVLVHGSGPNDRDEAVGPHKPFKDLAWGLGSRGIAVLRYDKRTLAYRGKLGSIEDFTVKDEVIDDALTAVELLRSVERVDPRRIFVLGHSLGGELAPRIGKRDPSVAGLISMAGSTRPFGEVLMEQTTYLYSLDGELSDVDKANLKLLKKKLALAQDPDLPKDTPLGDLPLGLPARYLQDLQSSNPAELASSLDTPMLILQGARDYQVTVEDFDGWKEHLSDKPNVTFKLYPKLNHHFMVGTGEGKSTPAEYSSAENVSQEVVEDIADWVKAQSGSR
ncbi:MAG: alpha/beta fold hydrolase [Candidatus Coatesbacteria bacterium]|nr:alpha/beta fold hydrolase [Candidatus Coatesbacteria bacterium]